MPRVYRSGRPMSHISMGYGPEKPLLCTHGPENAFFFFKKVVQAGGTDGVLWMATTRGRIDGKVVAQAMKVASVGAPGITDFRDSSIPGFILRVRGSAATWLLKTKNSTTTLGTSPEVGLMEARRKAEDARSDNRKQRPPNPVVEPVETFWTWGDLSSDYITHISGSRIKAGKEKRPSADTLDDVKRAFSRPALASWKDRPAASLVVDDLVDAVNETIKTVSYRQAQKLFAYVRGAMTYALSNRKRDSGLSDFAWWQALRMPQPTGEIVQQIVARQRSTAVKGFGIKQVADVLARHESYCQGREGNMKVSPGVRWGMWWAALTVVRGGAALALEIGDVSYDDPNLPAGWALAIYRSHIMKADRDFWLPIPPIGVRILSCVRRDWKEAMKDRKLAGRESKWLFPSNRLVGGDADPCMTKSGLSLHIKSMRGKRQIGHQDYLKGIPNFTPHSLRNAATDYLVDRLDIADGAASAMLSHALPVDPSVLKLSPTTRMFYDRAQRVPAKIDAMRAWSEALVAEYQELGGLMPI